MFALFHLISFLLKKLWTTQSGIDETQLLDFKYIVIITYFQAPWTALFSKVEMGFFFK